MRKEALAAGRPKPPEAFGSLSEPARVEAESRWREQMHQLLVRMREKSYATAAEATAEPWAKARCQCFEPP